MAIEFDVVRASALLGIPTIAVMTYMVGVTDPAIILAAIAGIVACVLRKEPED